ncbi:MAG TPA: hypothetical protein VMU24_08495 [Candidatus Acidoferrales bacterium]|nr:hypothetical protein [Candidatus Acidoferrales bacterium]
MAVLLERKFSFPLLNKSRNNQRTATPLADTLRKLEITPFDPHSVKAYKRDKMEQVCQRKTRGLIQFTPEPWDTFAGEVYISAIALARECGRTYGDRENTMLRFYSYRIPTFTLADSRIEYLPPYAVVLVWDVVEHPDVPTEMPPHVERKAKQIADAIPGVTFETETLRDQSRNYDPFLVVRLGDERYYVEVWDERDFEKTL